MTDNNPNSPKLNSARRGRGGRGGRRGGRKNYASEGDALTEMPTPAGSYPATPVKIYTGSPTPGSQPTLSKPPTNKKNYTKARPSNVSISLGAVGPSQRTPPASEPASLRLGLVSSSSASGGTTSHFASSSSFHSPAPSTLPRPAFPGFTTKSETSVRPRSESASIQQLKDASPSASDSEGSSPVQQTGAHVQQEAPEFSFQQRFDAERDRLRRANLATAAVPFSEPSRSQPFQLNDKPIPFPLPQRQAHRGISDNADVSNSAELYNCCDGSIGHSLPLAIPSQPYAQQRLSPQSSNADTIRNNMHPYSQNERISAAQPQMRYFSPQQAQAPQAAQHHPQHRFPHHTPAHVTQHHQFATPPPLDSSEELKKLLWGPPTPSLQMGHASAPNRSTSLPPPSSYPPPSGGPNHLDGFSSPSTSSSSNGGLDTRKSLAEDALRKVLGLNFPISMSSGLDGNRSPQGHYPGRA